MLKSTVVKKIIQIGDKLLSQKSNPLSKEEIFSRETQELIQDLIDTCESEKEDTAGLSAVQVGILRRVCVVRRLDLEEQDSTEAIWEVLINPEIEYLSKEKSTVWEGCMSIGEGKDRLFSPVTRANEVEVSYQDREGNKKTLVANGYFAHIVLHEYDHLEGVLFLRYVKFPENIWKSEDLDAYFAEHGDYPPMVE